MIDFSHEPPRLTHLPMPTQEQLAEVECGWRDIQLRNTDNLVARHRDESEMGEITTLTQEAFFALMIYRKALRDWPKLEGFPDIQYRPKSPSWMINQTH